MFNYEVNKVKTLREVLRMLKSGGRSTESLIKKKQSQGKNYQKHNKLDIINENAKSLGLSANGR
jgi:uncharacterized surface protein with fasciclin (FAS1) repeats